MKKIKTSSDKAKKAYFWHETIMYFTCPHCRKMVILSDKNAEKALDKWRKQKP